MSRKKKSVTIDFAKNIEEILLGIFLQTGKVFFTLYDFVLKPDFFASHIRGLHPIHNDYPKRYSRPATFFFILLSMLVGGFFVFFKSTAQTEHIENIFTKLIISAFEDGSLTKLVIGLLPFIFAFGLFAFCLSYVTRKKEKISFTDSLAMSAYFVGTVSTVYLLFIPVFIAVPTKEMNVYALVILCVISWSLLFRSIYCYFKMLKCIANTSRLATTKLFFKGLGLFFLLYFFIVIWLSPVVKELIGK